jgi:exo-1,4-beta-D-glucosaminidase
VPPSYWSTDTAHGGAFGFNTETSIGAVIPPRESLDKFIPADHRWPLDDVWRFHSDLAPFQALDVYDAAMDARYGPSSSIDDYAQKGQLAAYEGVRAMFEAYARRKYLATGVIQWMLNNAWPSLIWHLYDVYGKPGGGYFGAKMANQALHAMYAYDDRGIVVVNHRPTPSGALSVHARVLAPSGDELHRIDQPLQVIADEVKVAATLPAYSDLPTTYLLLVDLDEDGRPLSRDVYWLSTVADVPDWSDASNWYTPTASYGDLTGLQSMPMAQLTLSAQRTTDGVRVTVSNPGPTLAFFARIEVSAPADGEEILPVRWSDNYITLLPGESRILDARMTAPSGPLVVRGSGWNVASVSSPLP